MTTLHRGLLSDEADGGEELAGDNGGVVAVDTGKSRAGELMAQGGLLEQRFEGGGEGGDIAGGREQSTFAMGNDFGDGAGTGGDDGESSGHSFEQDDTEAFLAAGQAENIRVAIFTREFREGDVFEKADTVFEMELPGEAAQARELRADADDAQHGWSLKLRHGTQESGDIFAGIKVSDAEDGWMRASRERHGAARRASA